MGTPIVDLESLTSKLIAILTNPNTKAVYGQMLAQFNLDRQHWCNHRKRLEAADPHAVAKAAGLSVAEFAREMVDRAFGTFEAPKLIDPIEVGEILSAKSPVSLYRAYDGQESMTLSNWWSEEDLLRSVTSASPCRDQDGNLNHAQVLKLMLSSAFVHPHWNEGKDVAKMTIPIGSRVPVITGRGDWRAMTKAEPRELKRLPKNKPQGPRNVDPMNIKNENDVHEKLGMAAFAGTRQVFVPLFKDMWVAKVPHFSPEWPFA